MRHLLFTAALCLSALPATAQEFSIAFEWGNIPLCTTGRPNTVDSPAFTIRGLPAGTDTVEFKLVDIDVPNFNHGGGTLRINRNGTLPSGVFRYKSPCPPNGQHTYEWRAKAKAGRTVLGEARARRLYPE